MKLHKFCCNPSPILLLPDLMNGSIKNSKIFTTKDRFLCVDDQRKIKDQKFEKNSTHENRCFVHKKFDFHINVLVEYDHNSMEIG